MIEKSHRTVVGIFAILILFTASFSAIHPALAATPTGIIVPLYSYPGSTWTQIIQAKNAHPSVPIIAIINPNSGPGSASDSNFVTGIKNLQSAGITVLGYVYTSYAARSTSAAEADINSYKTWYNVNGIMFDEMSNVPGNENYYSTLTSYVKSHGMTMTVGNPGASTLASYIGTVDNITIYEGSGVPTVSSLVTRVFYPTYPVSDFSAVSYGVSTLDTTAETNESPYVSYLYITNDVLSNPYDTIPSYFGTEVAALDTGSSATAPGSPTSLTATSASSSQINLSWTAPSNNGGSAITGYKIERSSDSGTTWSTIANTSTSATTSSDTGLAASTTYTYRVSAINSVGTSSPSSIASATTSGNTSTTQVTISVNSVDLSGNPITGMSVVIRYTNGTTISDTFTPASFTVASGTTYVVHVRDYQTNVFNHWQDGTTNSYYTITPTQNVVLTAYYSTGTTVTAPQPPTGLTSTATSSSQINLSWTAPSNNGGSAITGYKIERSTDSGTTWSTIISNTATSATTYTNTGLASSTTYTYRISAINSVGTSTSSNTSSATTSSGTTGITVPQSPTSLTATAVSRSQINLSWTAPSNNGGSAITSYKIERSTDGGITWKTIVSNTGGTGTAFSNTGLLKSTAYTYRVSATNSIGTGLPSNIASATTFKTLSF